MRLRRTIGRFLGVSIGAGVVIDNLPDQWIPLPLDTLRRGSRTLFCMGLIALDYKWTFYRHDIPVRESIAAGRQRKIELGPGAETPAQLAHRLCHERSAQRVLYLCRRNAGLFVKIGQHLSSLNHVLPHSYTSTLSVLQNAAPVTPTDAVRRTLESDLGGPLHRFFEQFDETPLAAASLAQVHEARTTPAYGSQRVAVKIQHPALRRQFDGDMWAHWAVLSIAEFMFPNFPLTWTHEEVRSGLASELDFRNEARNAERAAAHFAARHGTGAASWIHVPAVDHRLTGGRVLTMEFIDGVSVVNARQLQFSPHDVCTAAIRMTGEQLFLDGFVHCDPHPGNVYVRARPGARPGDGAFQLVLLDHGLYRELSETTRLAYAQFWKSMVLGDDAGVERSARAMGIDDWELFAVITLNRPYRNGMHGVLAAVLPQERRRFQQEFFAERQLTDVMDTMKAMPRELLLSFRALNYLRYLDRELGSSVNRYATLARVAVDGASPSFHSQLAATPGQVIQPVKPWWWTRVSRRASFEIRMLWFSSWIFLSDKLLQLIRMFDSALDDSLRELDDNLVH